MDFLRLAMLHVHINGQCLPIFYPFRVPLPCSRPDAEVLRHLRLGKRAAYWGHALKVRVNTKNDFIAKKFLF